MATYNAKNRVLVTVSWIKCMSLNQILYTLFSRFVKSGFLYCICICINLCIEIFTMDQQQFETFLSSCLCGLFFSNFYMGVSSPPKKFKNSKLGMETRNYGSKSWYEALTPRKFDVLKDSVSYELWLSGSGELVEEHTDVPCFMDCQKCFFGKCWVNDKKIPI